MNIFVHIHIHTQSSESLLEASTHSQEVKASMLCFGVWKTKEKQIVHTCAVWDKPHILPDSVERRNRGHAGGSGNQTSMPSSNPLNTNSPEGSPISETGIVHSPSPFCIGVYVR